MNFKSVNVYLLVLLIVVTLLSLLGIISLSALEIAAYACLLWGISFFYSSFQKQYKAGIVIGAIIFLTGGILFVFAKFEILNFGTVFIPSTLIIIGFSLLIANLLTRINGVAVLFSVLCLFAGTWLLISRGTPTMDLYLSAVFSLIKSYWIVVLFLLVVIFMISKNSKKKNNDQV
ncbi:MAG TPA: hypothetical protein DHV28_11850 [Ignavibacteriales bacterium]|nr:hypothetical protein [Ignavibacteriales bacterium]